MTMRLIAVLLCLAAGLSYAAAVTAAGIKIE